MSSCQGAEQREGAGVQKEKGGSSTPPHRDLASLSKKEKAEQEYGLTPVLPLPLNPLELSHAFTAMFC